VANLLNASSDNPQQTADAIAEAVVALKAGELIIVPTDTVYGLACSASLPDAALQIFQLKGRNYQKQLPVLAKDLAQARQVASTAPPTLETLARAYWPGPLTVIVGRSQAVVPEVTGGLDTIGLRVPDHPVVLELLAQFGTPLAATSANTSDTPAPATVSEIKPTLLEQVAVVLDAGPCLLKQPSTVVDLTSDPPVILRPGPISATDLSQTLHVSVITPS